MLSVKEKIGRNIKKLRCDKNLSQEKLAELMGLSTPAISNIENGKTLTSFATLEKMTKILDVNLYELFLFCGECKEEILYKKLFENINKPEIIFRMNFYLEKHYSMHYLHPFCILQIYTLDYYH